MRLSRRHFAEPEGMCHPLRDVGLPVSPLRAGTLCDGCTPHSEGSVPPRKQVSWHSQAKGAMGLGGRLGGGLARSP